MHQDTAVILAAPVNKLVRLLKVLSNIELRQVEQGQLEVAATLCCVRTLDDTHGGSRQNSHKAFGEVLNALLRAAQDVPVGKHGQRPSALCCTCHVHTRYSEVHKLIVT